MPRHRSTYIVPNSRAEFVVHALSLLFIVACLMVAIVNTAALDRIEEQERCTTVQLPTL